MSEYKLTTNIDEILGYIKCAKEIAFDIETSPKECYREDKGAAFDPHKSNITGISISVKPESAIYIPFRHRVGSNANFEAIFEQLKEYIFLNKNVVKIAHNLGFEAMLLYKYGIVLAQPVYDTIAAAQLTLKSDKDFRILSDCGLKTLVSELLKTKLLTYEEVTVDKHFDELSPLSEETINYACADSDYALRLYYLFNSWFRTYMPKHERVVRELESPTSVMVGIMKFNGLMVDKLLMYQKQLEAEDKILALKNTLDKIAGRELNIGNNASTDALKRFLYKEQELPILKTTTKYKAAVDDEALILLMEWCKKNRPMMLKFIETISKYRKWAKLKSTYIDGILNFINPITGAVHTDLLPLATETGRFASRNPNCQNFPRKDNDPIGIRNFFVARKGHVFLDYDFSQIELRVGAYYCRDEKMLDTYRIGGDIHAKTTSVIYSIPFDQAIDKNAENYKERRSIAKNCNFGVFFGLFPKGLQRNLRFKAGLSTTLFECEEIVRNLKHGYPMLVKWQEETKKIARFREYSETAFGRRRYLKGINSRDWGIKSYWERCALNTPIQGTAADCLKLAMARITEELQANPYIKPILTIHDELIFEVPEDKVVDAAKVIKKCMEQVPFEGFDVPIIAEGTLGARFGELREVEE